MTTRATRSQQKAVDAANASPARSTRSGVRSSSPALSIGGRALSPGSLQSISPAARGRAATNISPSAARGTRNARKEHAEKSDPARGGWARGRGRRRGRGRHTKSKQVSQTELAENDAETTSDMITEIETSTPADDNNAPNDVTEDTDVGDSKHDTSSTTEVVNATKPEVAEIGDMTSQLVDTEQWSSGAVDIIESVLASDEGLDILSRQPEAIEAINDMNLDDQDIQVRQVTACLE